MRSHPVRINLSRESAGETRKLLIVVAVTALIILLSTELVNAQIFVTTYTVNTTADTLGASGACTSGAAGCSLRGAIEAANGNPGEEYIQIDLSMSDPNFNGIFWTINLTGVLPDIMDSVSIFGPGADKLTVRRSSGGIYRIFSVTTTGTVVFSGLTISNGAGPGGGAIGKGNPGIVNVSNCTLSGNSISGSGGGGAVVSGNGGGTMNIHNSTLSGNSADANGGGVFNNSGGTMNITNSTLSGNSADANGGGVFNNSGGTMNITNSTFSGNSAYSGGGILDEGALTITNSTVTNNSAVIAGGVRSTGSTPANVKSSIIAMNTFGGGGFASDVFGSFNPAGFNLIGENDDASASFPAGNPNANNDIVGTSFSPIDPNFELDFGKPLLKNNGGPTQTVALLFGSPAIDKGTSNGSTGTLSTDQRGSGFPRTFDDPAIPNATGGDGTDVGAFELQTAPPPTPTPTPTPTATPTPPTTLANISTRLRVETGDNVLIGGFIVTGTQPKKVIVRAIGTSLPFADKLADPILELHGPNGLIESNDNWVDSPNKQAIIDSTIPPTSDFESAIVATLPANSTGYTAIVRGVNGGTGIGVVEAYDLDTAANSKLANISTRGFVQTGDNVLIAGTIVVGQTPQRVLIRAIGPSLPITGKMENPTLELRDSSGTLLQANDNWVDSADKQAIMDTTIPPTNDLESAILANLPANNASYTAILRGVNDTTGIAVVEVYALQ